MEAYVGTGRDGGEKKGGGRGNKDDPSAQREKKKGERSLPRVVRVPTPTLEDFYWGVGGGENLCVGGGENLWWGGERTWWWVVSKSGRFGFGPNLIPFFLPLL